MMDTTPIGKRALTFDGAGQCCFVPEPSKRNQAMTQARNVRSIRYTALLAAASLFWSCGSSTDVEKEEEPGIVRGPEWVESTHGNVPADTLAAFPQARRRTLVLSMPDTAWTGMLESMHQACGSGTAISVNCTGAGLDAFPDVSAWHEGDLLADGQRWASIGFRLRSNGELADAWKAGTRRFPFRITMDKWEDLRPTIKNQRFHGFQKLSLLSLADDSTLLRHHAASTLYRAAGVPVLRGTLVDFRLAHGSDTIDMGVYALREAVDEPFLGRWFSAKTGNWYEPSSILSSYVAAEFTEGDNDGTRTDVQVFFGALNDSRRTTDPAAWRASMRSAFNVAGFLKWLAVSTAMVDRGSYGYKAENYGLYADQGKLHWVALNADETFPTGNGIYRDVWHTDAATSWPLINKVLADSAFCAEYVANTRSLVASTGPLAPSNLEASLRVSGQILTGLPDAEARIQRLLGFVQARAGVVDSSLSAHPCPWKG